VNNVDAPGLLVGTSSIGTRRHALATSTGKAILAWSPPDVVEQALGTVEPFTPLTVTRRDDVALELQLTRARGYAVNRGETRIGVGGIAAPVRNRKGKVVASLGIWGAVSSILGARELPLAHQVIAVAGRLSAELGFVAPQSYPEP
jgi:DNA-binding IclR family transcriptional regulator